MAKISMSHRKRIWIPLGAGLAGAVFLMGVYFGIVTWVESPKHAVEFFWQDRWIVIPIIFGFGVQSALYTILKLRLYLPVMDLALAGSANSIQTSGASVGASGTTSTIAMVACCAHHVTDVLPILGLTAAATFLAKYRQAFMGIGLGTTVIGIVYMGIVIIHERRRLMQSFLLSNNAPEVS